MLPRRPSKKRRRMRGTSSRLRRKWRRSTPRACLSEMQRGTRRRTPRLRRTARGMGSPKARRSSTNRTRRSGWTLRCDSRPSTRTGRRSSATSRCRRRAGRTRSRTWSASSSTPTGTSPSSGATKGISRTSRLALNSASRLLPLPRVRRPKLLLRRPSPRRLRPPSAKRQAGPSASRRVGEPPRPRSAKPRVSVADSKKVVFTLVMGLTCRPCLPARTETIQTKVGLGHSKGSSQMRSPIGAD
mmetsp:Transcript_51888/g.121840  ORF Transcript_51888/g.121840 Transcript_51888/m.121840 type:complete len:243 (+) Transcript_51888:489-1217(+)